MINADFKGYTGEFVHGVALSHDLLFMIILVMLAVFAWMFRINVPLFGKMARNINAGEKIQSIFETTEKESLWLNAFLLFQTLFLFCVFLFWVAVKYRYILDPDVGKMFRALGALLALFALFYLFKMTLYTLFGSVFIEKSTRKSMFTNYQALFNTWGIILYLPVLWILLFDRYFFIPVIVFIISYLIFRATLLLRFFYIFFNKNTGLLFFSLYLCAQEIAPLVFLYKGMVYTYNFIET